MPRLTEEKKELRSDRAELQEAVGDFRRAATSTEKTAATDRVLRVVLKKTGLNLTDDKGDNGREHFASVVASLNPGQVLNMGIAQTVESSLRKTGESFEVPESVLKRLDKLV
jgi:hypothetical protein